MQSKGQIPLISLCIVTRDNAAHLPLTLNSARKLIDEIIVVDLGSNDGTQRIAREFDARVFNGNHLSEARKDAVKYAQGDWILQLDPGHEIVAGDNQNFRNRLIDNNYDGFYVPEYSSVNLYDYYYQPVIFKKLPNLTFNRIFDESPILSTEPSDEFSDKFNNIGLMQNVRLYHRAINLKNKKIKKNINGILNALKSDSQNISLYFNLAFFQRELGHKDEFQIAVQDGIQIMTQNNVELMLGTRESTGLFGYFAESLVENNVLEERTINSLVKLQKTLPSDIRFNTPLAVLLHRIGRTKEALNLLQEAIQLSYKPRGNTLSFYESFVFPVYQLLEIIRQSKSENELINVILNIQNLSNRHGFGMRSVFLFLKDCHPEFLNLIDGILKRKLSSESYGKEPER